jgi:hypothetical protein
MATPTKKITATFTIDKEPSGGGGRRFQEVESSLDNGDEVFGRIYLNQAGSRALDNPGKFKITVEPA